MTRSNGFRPCPACDGRGFVRVGIFGARSFSPCTGCHGCGQVYCDPEPPPADSDAIKTDADEQPWVCF